MILREVMEHLEANLKHKKPKLEKIVVNSGFSGMLLDNGQMGLAMNIRSGGCIGDREIEKFLTGTIGKPGLEAAVELDERCGYLPAENNSTLLLRSLLVALLNALSLPLLNEEYLGPMGYKLTAGAGKHAGQMVKEGETVTIVGYGGMVRNVAQIAGKTYVSELTPGLFKSTIISGQGITYGPQCAQLVASGSAGSYFRASDTLFITGCALVSNTMEEILGQCRGRRVIVYGHTAGIFPEPLFKRGVSIITTGRVIDSALMVDLLTNCAGAVERFFPQAAEGLQICK